MRTVLLLVVSVVLTACAAGGIAGAGSDFEWQIREAKEFEPFVAPFVHESVVATCDKSVKQQFAGIFREFRASYPRVAEEPIRIELNNSVATYRDPIFEIRTDGKLLVREKLPSVFHMHPMSLGIHSVAGREIVMISGRSRATTHLSFVAIYGADGQPYYKKVLSSVNVWDVKATDAEIEILGQCESRRITFDPASVSRVRVSQ